MDIDFAVKFVHPGKRGKVDLEKLITDLGYLPVIGGSGPIRTPIPESFEHLIRSYSNTESGVDSNTFRIFTGT
jgi:hypothetical protein